MASPTPSNQAVAVNNVAPPVGDIWLVSQTAGTVVIKGTFQNDKGKQTGAAISTTINIAGGTPLQISPTPPNDAVGFSGTIDGAVYVAAYSPGDVTTVGGSTLISADFTTNYASYSPFDAGSVSFGSVATSGGTRDDSVVTAGAATAANQLAGFSKDPTTLTVGTAAYIAGDCMGGILSFATVNFSTGRPIAIDSLKVTDKSNQSPPLTIYWFKATPSGGTYTDGSPLVLAAADADIPNLIGITKVLAADWTSLPSATPTASIAFNSDLNQVLNPAATTLFALVQTDVAGSTTFTAGDIGITISGRKL